MLSSCKLVKPIDWNTVIKVEGFDITKRQYYQLMRSLANFEEEEDLAEDYRNLTNDEKIMLFLYRKEVLTKARSIIIDCFEFKINQKELLLAVRFFNPPSDDEQFKFEDLKKGAEKVIKEQLVYDYLKDHFEVIIESDDDFKQFIGGSDKGEQHGRFFNHFYFTIIKNAVDKLLVKAFNIEFNKHNFTDRYFQIKRKITAS